MKNYEKPILLVNEEIAEGIYAASGDEVFNENWVDRGEAPHKGQGFHHIEIKEDCGNRQWQKVTVTVGCQIDRVEHSGNCSDIRFHGNTITYYRDCTKGNYSNGECGNLYIKGRNNENVQVTNVRVEGCR